MDRAGADWQLIIYGGAMHGFTHQHVMPGAVPGVASDDRSFAATRAFLAERSPDLAALQRPTGRVSAYDPDRRA